MKEEPTSIEADLEPIEIGKAIGRGPVFVSGEPAGDRLRVRYFRRRSDGAMIAKAWFGPGSEGPPGHAHGGSIAAVLDEAMGLAAWVAGHAVVAGRLTTTFRAMLPLNREYTVEAWIERCSGRKITTKCHLTDGEQIYAEGEALFVKLDAEKLSILFDEARSDAGDEVP